MTAPPPEEWFPHIKRQAARTARRYHGIDGDELAQNAAMRVLRYGLGDPKYKLATRTGYAVRLELMRLFKHRSRMKRTATMVTLDDPEMPVHIAMPERQENLTYLAEVLQRMGKLTPGQLKALGLSMNGEPMRGSSREMARQARVRMIHWQETGVWLSFDELKKRRQHAVTPNQS